MANSVDLDQTAPEGAVWSGATLFAYAILLETLVLENLGHWLYVGYPKWLLERAVIFGHISIGAVPFLYWTHRKK